MCVCVCACVCVCVRVLVSSSSKKSPACPVRATTQNKRHLCKCDRAPQAFNHTHISGVTRCPCGVDGESLSGQAEPFLTKQTDDVIISWSSAWAILFYPASHNPTQYLLYERDSILDFSFAFSFSLAGLTL